MNKVDTIFNNLEMKICFHLDQDIYFPMKEEINAMCEFPPPHTLGMKKEDFKSTIHKLVLEAKRELEESK